MMMMSAVLHRDLRQFRPRGLSPIMTGNILSPSGRVQVIERLLLERDDSTDMVACFL